MQISTQAQAIFSLISGNVNSQRRTHWKPLRSTLILNMNDAKSSIYVCKQMISSFHNEFHK